MRFLNFPCPRIVIPARPDTLRRMNEASAGLKGWILGLSIFVMGGCGIAYEHSLSKVSSDLLGNSVQQWAVVIAVMLFFMGVGARIPAKLLIGSPLDFTRSLAEIRALERSKPS